MDFLVHAELIWVEIAAECAREYGWILAIVLVKEQRSTIRAYLAAQW